MKFTANYKPMETPHGTITQSVRIECTEVELGYINYRIKQTIESEKYQRLYEGKQIVGVETMQALNKNVCNNDKRIKEDRESLIEVVITQRKKRNTDGECVSCRYSSTDLKYCTLHGIKIYQSDMGCSQWKR